MSDTAVDYSQLAAKLTEALDCAIPEFLEKGGGDSLLAFGIYVSEELSYISFTGSPNVAESSSLSAWSPPDWSLHLYKQDCLKGVEDELLRGWDEDYSEFQIDHERLERMYNFALKQARDKYFHGSETVVGIFMGGVSNRVVINSVASINPSEVSDRFIKAITT